MREKATIILMIPPQLAEKYDIRGLIGRGAFSQVYEGTTYTAVHISTNSVIALKITELEECPSHSVEPAVLSLKTPPAGVPKLIAHEVVEDSGITALQLLGSSFYTMMQAQRTPLSVAIVVKGTYDVLKILKWLHRKGYVHRDVKPDNMLLGLGELSRQTFLIDYSEARKFRFQSDMDSMVGNPNFISLNVLRGGIEGPKDDLESLICSAVYLLTGSLPWMGILEMDPLRLKTMVAEQKEATSPEKLCKKVPIELQKMLEYVRTIKGTEIPDYKLLLEMTKTMAKRVEVHLNSHMLKPHHKYKRNSFSVVQSVVADSTVRSSSLHNKDKLSPVLSKLSTKHHRALSSPGVNFESVNTEDIPTVVSTKLPALTSRLLQELLRRRMVVKR